MGSAFGLAIVTYVFNDYAKPSFRELGVPSLEEQLFIGDPNVPSAIQHQIRTIFAEGYSRQILVLCGFSGAQLIAVALMWKRKQILLGQD
jgi:hypothetical protein